MSKKNEKLSRWYFGGLASAGAACVTHPLDLLKTFSAPLSHPSSERLIMLEPFAVTIFERRIGSIIQISAANDEVHLQTQQEGKTSVSKITIEIIKKQGVLALYSGLTASLLRQLTYSTTRFGCYEVGKQALESPGYTSPFHHRLILAGLSGAVGGVIGTPADLINVRMQNDVKVAAELRRNYKHALDGLVRVWREEGFLRLFSGCSTATSRAALMTIGQLSFYDQIKMLLLESGMFTDNPTTHFLSSLSAGAIATTLTQPLDVLKTRAMNAKPGEFKSTMELILYTAKLGPLGFFKGYIPAFVRLAPHTILTFVFLEQLRSNFGFTPKAQ